MFNVLVHYVKNGLVQSKSYAEIADNECIAMQKALLDCKKEYQCGLNDMRVVDIEEV